jgi:hypothetical protein
MEANKSLTNIGALEFSKINNLALGKREVLVPAAGRSLAKNVRDSFFEESMLSALGRKNDSLISHLRGHRRGFLPGVARRR